MAIIYLIPNGGAKPATRISAKADRGGDASKKRCAPGGFQQ